MTYVDLFTVDVSVLCTLSTTACTIAVSLQYGPGCLGALSGSQNLAKSGTTLAQGEWISHSIRQTEKVRNKHSELALSPLISTAVCGDGTLLLSPSRVNLICAPPAPTGTSEHGDGYRAIGTWLLILNLHPEVSLDSSGVKGQFRERTNKRERTKVCLWTTSLVHYLLNLVIQRHLM